MNNIDIVKILGTGLSGFGFLLMYLAYKLIKSLVPLPKVNPAVVKIINRYMLVCFVMTVIVGLFTFMSTAYKNGVISTQAAKLASKDTVLNLLSASQRNKLLSDSISNGRMVSEAKARQRNYLDTLQKYIDPAQHERFMHYKATLTTLADSLSLSGLDDGKRSLLKDQYRMANDSITRLSLKAVSHYQ
jgi:hypothetical protein